MTRPRQVLPGTTCLLVRRCLERRRLLHFDRQSRQIWRFCLGLALERHGLQVHAWCVLQDQHLLVISDPLGNLCAFAQELHANLARALDRMRRRCQTLWAPGSFSESLRPGGARGQGLSAAAGNLRSGAARCLAG